MFPKEPKVIRVAAMAVAALRGIPWLLPACPFNGLDREGGPCPVG